MIDTIFCHNLICENTENYETCPLDCLLNQSDHLCLAYDDGICDPDCAIDVDPNCGLDLVNLSILLQNSTQVIYEFDVQNFANQTMNNITWSFHTGDILENSSINFSLNYLEDIFVYFEHVYNNTGTYAVNVTVESEIFKDEESINITI